MSSMPFSANGSAGPDELLNILTDLRKEVSEEGERLLSHWKPFISRNDFLPSAKNLAYYLSLRKHDLRRLQSQLRLFGLSTLGRTESHVLPNLDAIINTLSYLTERNRDDIQPRPSQEEFDNGDELLLLNVEEIFGRSRGSRTIRIMVTLPTEAAVNPKLIHQLLDQGVDCFRINCSHDTSIEWEAMVRNIREAERDLGFQSVILMDLGGPKLRTIDVRTPSHNKKIGLNSVVLLTGKKLSGRSRYPFQMRFSHPEIIERINVGQEVWMDDGHVGMRVIEKLKDSLVLQVTHVRSKGETLKADKGINIPGIDLGLPPLTEKDIHDLDFVAEHAQMIGYSFVQRPEDIKLLQQELEKRLGVRANNITIVAKIETPLAVRNLPELIVEAAGKQPFAVMIARGDLAIEIGYERLAEIQEEIMWISEAAHVPVIWATQVLETLVKTGMPSRAEMTDAAMGERAECVMLNKGPFILDGIKTLDKILKRMQDHHHKKTTQLRALKMWKDLV